MIGLFSFKNPRFKLIFIIAMAVVLIASASVAGYKVISSRGAVIDDGRIAVPAFVGRDLEQVKSTARSLGLKIKIDRWVQSKIYPIDHVVTQRPLPNKKVSAGDTIIIKVSGGRKYGQGTKVEQSDISIKDNPKPLPSPAITPSCCLTDKVVVIDPGHQSKADLSREPIGPGATQMKEKVTGGASGIKSRTPEYKITLAVSKLLKAKLEASGIKVIMTRTTHNVKLSNIERAAIANKAHADLFVRIHTDGAADAKVNGISTLYPALNKWTGPIYKESLKAARIVQDDVVVTTDHKDNGIVARGDLTGFNWSKVPTVLVETGFLSNPEEDILLNSPSYQQLIADGIAKGIISYLQSSN
ncbi:MAG: N-acetylmuramoyl-L-alanine amidase family protein [Candidatus Aquicultor sp.]